MPPIDQQDFVAKIHGGVMIVLPDSLDSMTSYIVQEQGDWFEDEIKFVRELMRPGMRVIDVGANYGLYALSMAGKVGAEGHVWAFEPASSTAGFLKRSITHNEFGNVTVIQCALSSRTGTAKLGLNRNSELNTLRPENGGMLEMEEVALTTLDRYTAEHGCERIDFVKLDAEGEESNIIRGGAAFFAKESPLVMYELEQGQITNHALIRQFEDLGYRPYRLVPGLNLLAPFDSTEGTNQLNLFCCKDDRAQLLEKRGILSGAQTAEVPPGESDDSSWRNLLESRSFAKSMSARWRKQLAGQPLPGWKDLKKSMELYAIAHDPAQSSNSRYAALTASYGQLAAVCGESPNLGRLCTFARVSWELGHRLKALEIISRAFALWTGQQPTMLDEPFLPVSSRFDDIDPGDRFNAWMAASLLEQGEYLRSYSSYYTGESSLGNLEALLRTGFASPQMERRRQLIQMRNGLRSQCRTMCQNVILSLKC
jgi:FkbM family methyltransferase